jgi:hypothetical protein
MTCQAATTPTERAGQLVVHSKRLLYVRDKATIRLLICRGCVVPNIDVFCPAVHVPLWHIPHFLIPYCGLHVASCEFTLGYKHEI